MKPFYNTIKATGKDLVTYIEQAKGQEKQIIDIFVKNKRELSPDQVHELGFDHNTPITSIRRAITNLTQKGVLRKTDNLINGKYGKPTHTWRLMPSKLQTELFE